MNNKFHTRVLTITSPHPLPVLRMPNTGAVYKPRAARKIASSRSGVSSSRFFFFFFSFTKEYIHAIPHRQPWLHGAYLQSFDTTTTLMKLFLLAYRPQVMTKLYSYPYFLILNTITTTSPLLPYPSPPHPIRQHGGEVVPQATLENV